MKIEGGLTRFLRKVAPVLAVAGLPLATYGDSGTTQPSEPRDPLAQRIDVTLDGLTIQQVIAQIQDKTHLNLVLDDSGGDLRSGANVDFNSTLHGKLEHVTVEEAIRLALTDANCLRPIVVEQKDNIFRIRTDSVVDVRVFHIATLLAKLHAEKPSLDEKEILDNLIKAIQSQIESETWRDAGGTIGSIYEFSGRLIVTQSKVNLDRTKKLLDELEADHAR